MTRATESHGARATPLVSLVLPAWNPNPLWLQEAVASALAQEGCDIELIVVDDGSDAPVEDLLSEVEDKRMRVLRIRHGRVSRARNAGIELARGDYFRFIDCDDVVTRDSTAHLLALAGGAAEVVANGATLVCDDTLEPLSTIGSDLRGSVAESCLLNRFSTTIHSLLFPRRIVEQIGPWEPAIVVSQDWDYSLRAFERADVRGDGRIATHYRLHDRMNSRNVEEGIRGYRLVVERYFERHPGQRGTRLERRSLALFHLFASVQLATARRRYRESASHLWRALRLDPREALASLPSSGMPLTPTPARLRRLLPRR